MFLFFYYLFKILLVYQYDYTPIHLYSFYLQQLYTNPFYWFLMVKNTIFILNSANIGKKKKPAAFSFRQLASNSIIFLTVRKIF